MGNSLIKVLVVEDHNDDAEIMMLELEASGLEVSWRRVQTADAMREALMVEDWDIVLSDYSMPQFSGSDALRLVQETGLDLPFIIVSGAIGEMRAVEIMKAGAHDYVMKGNLSRLPPAVTRELREAEGRRAHQLAEQIVHKLSRALDQSASLVMITDIEGMIEYINPAFTYVTGYTSNAVIGKHSRIVRPGLTPSETYGEMWSTILAGDTWRGELQNKKKNGDLFWVETIISAIKNASGEITQFLSVQEDITERKRLEAELQRYTNQLENLVEKRTIELRQTKEQLELILNNTNDAVALANPNGDILLTNAAFRVAFDQQSPRSIEHILRSLPNVEHVELLSGALLNVIYNSETQRVMAQIVSGEGQEKDVDMVFIPVRGSDDAASDVILVSAHDITYIKEIERFKARFIADALHDMATPIAGLSMRLYMLRRSPEHLDNHVQALENQVAHLSNLLADLRTLSLLDRQSLNLHLDRYDFNQIARRVFDTYEPVALGKAQTISLSADVTMPTMLLDSNLIERVLGNLVSNAINYTPNGKTIAVQTSVAIDAQRVAFTVADEGIGIDVNDLPHIFERFYRTARARKEQFAGTGLGLAIVKEIVELHGGEVSVESELGRGSIFTIRLPLTP